MNRNKVYSTCICGLGLLVAGGWIDVEAGDFDGNGLADLAIGAQGENVSGISEAGAVGVLYGTAAGLDGAGNQHWTQNALGFHGEPWDRFGRALATGDFDGDGVFDLAVGVPFEDVGTVEDAGAVNVIYGARPDGLVTTGNQIWTQDEPGMADTAENEDFFGDSLAAGDFNGDGFDDLAIGAPGEDMGSAIDAGAVHVLHGSAGGLQAYDDVLWNQDMAGSLTWENDRFGYTVAGGDFDGDGFDDLAIGVPYEDFFVVDDAGAVNILYGSPFGLVDRASDDRWYQGRSGIPDVKEESDQFGRELGVGDFDGDGHDDLAIGVPGEDLEGTPDILDAGAVHVLYGSAVGLDATDNDYFHQDNANIGSLAEEGDRFGQVLAGGDFNGDGHDDLAVGVPYEDWNYDDTGIVQVIWGWSTGLTGTDELWRQDLLDNFGMDEENDRFGWALAAGDFDGDGYDELAVGTPDKDLLPVLNCGVVYVLPGTAGGLSSANQWWHQGKDDLLDDAESFDGFGYSLVSIPGPMSVFFSDGFESGDTAAWSSAVP